MQLYERAMANGVFIFPGANFFCAEPGWFRIIFAMETEILQLGKLIIKQAKSSSKMHMAVSEISVSAISVTQTNKEKWWTI